MPLRIALDNYYIILTHCLTVIIAIFISFSIFIMAKKNRLLYLYLLTQLMLILWVFSKILKTAAPNLSLRWFFIVTQYFGICFLGSVFVMFAYTYSHHKAMRLRSILLLNLPSVLLFLVVVTNPLHMKFYATFDMYRDSFGPLFYFHQITVYLYLVSGIVLCSKGFRRQFRSKKVQARLFSIAILFPIFINLLYIFKVLKKLFGIRLPMDITPISCLASLLIFSLAALRYRFIDITPLAYKEALHQSQDGILLLDRTNAILEHNLAFDRYFRQLCSKEEHERLEHNSQPEPSFSFVTLAEFLHLLEGCVEPSILQQFTEYMNSTFTTMFSSMFNSMFNSTFSSMFSSELRLLNGTCYKVLMEPVCDRRKNVCGAMIRFIDITSKKEILHNLTKKNQELEEVNLQLEQKAEVLRCLTITKARSYMAKEVHDILGHSVVLVLAMLEVALLNLRKGKIEIEEYLSPSVELIKNGLSEIEKCTRETDTVTSDHISLLQTLNLLAKQLKASNIVLDITVQGKSYELDSKQSEALYKICREAITNAIRHGKANLITIIIRFYSNCYELYILDNGNGCTDIIKGMGLKGMEENAATIGGQLHVNSSADSGFMLFLSVAHSFSSTK